jgi:nitrite reductase/ring-hydroxylating ferredoxin subunit
LVDEFERVAAVGDLASGEMTLVTANGEDIVLARVGDSYYAVEAICSHAFGMLNEGTLHGHELECPIHEGRFDLRTGEPTHEPADQPITAYEVRVEDDMIHVGPPKA